GFKTPPHLIETVTRALRDGYNSYGPSAGIAPAREAVAAEYTRTGFPASADRVFITAGTSEGIELTLSALIDEGGEVLVPMPTYPLYTAVLAKLGAKAPYYRTARASRSRRADHFVLEPLEGLSRARMAHRLDGNRPVAAARRCGGRGEEAGRWSSVQHRADAVRGRRGVERRPIAPDDVPRGAEGARAADRRPAARHARRQLRAAERSVLCDAEGDAAAGENRRRLRAGAAALDRRAVRVWIRLRTAERRWISPHRLPGAAR